MNIKPKNQQVHSEVKKEWKKVPYSTSIHREDMEALCGFGKYLHKTWGYVCKNDLQYADWVRRELLL